MLKNLLTFAFAVSMGCSASPALATDQSAVDAALEYLHQPGVVGRDLAVIGTPAFIGGLVTLLAPVTLQETAKDLALSPRRLAVGLTLTIGGGVLLLTSVANLMIRAHQLIHTPEPMDAATREKVNFLKAFFAAPLVRQRHLARQDEALANFVIDYAEYLRWTLPPPTFH